MATKYLSCVETAALIRKALEEAFPDVRFSVRSSSYSGGSLVHVRWTDGPSQDLVSPIARVFQGSYFDGSIDYQGSVFHMLDGQEVHFGADYVNCSREHSKKAISRAIDRVVSKARIAGERPSIEQYQCGALRSVHLPSGDDMDSAVRASAFKHTDRVKARPSTTAGKVFPTRDDGYSKACGAGHSAVNVDQ